MSRHAATMGNAVRAILEYTEEYAKAYRAELGQPGGDDAIIGDQGIANILLGVDNLLNGELGRQDGATLSRLLHAIRAEHKIEE